MGELAGRQIGLAWARIACCFFRVAAVDENMVSKPGLRGV